MAHNFPITGWRRVHEEGLLQEGQVLVVRLGGLFAISGCLCVFGITRLCRISDGVASFTEGQPE